MKKIIFKYMFLLFCLFMGPNLTAQVSLKQDGTMIDSSALMELQALDKGFLLPRMTQDNRINISSPENGLLIFQTDGNQGFQYNAGSSNDDDWTQMTRKGQIKIIDPRTPLDILDTNGGGNITITQPGSYYLRDNLVVTSNNGDGIRIDSDNVTIDLNGFAIIAGSQNTDDGIALLGAHNNITIKNGIITGFDDHGIYAFNADQCTFVNLRVDNNGEEGIVAGQNCLLLNCIATNNGDDGLEADRGCIIQNCTASYNGVNGIKTSFGSLIYNCTSFKNTSDGVSGGNGNCVEGCATYGNKIHGIDLSVSGLCFNNTAYRNGEHGLDISSSSLVMNNISNENGTCIENGTCTAGSGAGINTSQGAGIRTFANAVIIRNQCIGNYFGISASSSDIKLIGNDVQNNSHAGIIGTSSGSLYIKNTAHGNGFEQSSTVTDLEDYPTGDIVFGPFAFTNGSIGPIINVIGAGDISTISNSDHPFANIVY